MRTILAVEWLPREQNSRERSGIASARVVLQTAWETGQWLTGIIKNRFEKEFDGVQDVFELQVRNDAPFPSCRPDDRVMPTPHEKLITQLVPAQPQQRLRLRSRPFPYRRRRCPEGRQEGQRLCHRRPHL